MIGHTPGPWEIVPGDEWTCDVGTPEGDYPDGRKRHYNVASVNRRRDEYEANIRLIAAAPELLSIARHWVALDSGAWHAERHAAEKAELLADTLAAIAKAQP